MLSAYRLLCEMGDFGVIYVGMDSVIKIIADGAVVPIVLIGVYALLRHVPNKQKFRVYSHVLMAGLTSYVAAKIIGFLYQPETMRPFEILGVDPGASFLDNPGFPSDHALFTMAITLAIWFATRNRALALTSLILTLAVSVGRVLALVHTPLDVIGGMLIACVGVFWYLPLSEKKPTHKSSKQAK